MKVYQCKKNIYFTFLYLDLLYFVLKFLCKYVKNYFLFNYKPDEYFELLLLPINLIRTNTGNLLYYFVVQ